MEVEKLKKVVLDFLDNSKIEDIITIDTTKSKSALSDYIIIGSGRSGTQIESTLENLKTYLKEKKNITGRISGKSNDGWVIFDLNSIILHLFVPAVRDIYKLEELYLPKKSKTKLDKKEKKETKSKNKTTKTTSKKIVKKTVKKVKNANKKK